MVCKCSRSYRRAQVPPMRASSSSTTTSIPLVLSAAAAESPDAPPPTTMTSAPRRASYASCGFVIESLWAGPRPRIVAAIRVRKRPPRIDHRRSDTLFVGHAIHECRAEIPHFDWQPDGAGRAVSESKRELRRHQHHPPIGEMDVGSTVGTSGYRVDRLVEARCAVDPSPPEPVEVHSRLIAHQAKEIRRGRMLESPGPDVLAKRGIESFLAQYFVPQHLHHERGLLVSHPEEIVHLGRVDDQCLFLADPGVVRVQMQRMHFDRVAVGRAAEISRGVGEIDEGVEPLVHPWI